MPTLEVSELRIQLLEIKIAELEDRLRRAERGAQGEQGERGPQGERGERGPIGLKGRDGEDGRSGVDGVDGANWYAGAFLDGTMGKDGDFYFLKDGTVYQKINGRWQKVLTLDFSLNTAVNEMVAKALSEMVARVGWWGDAGSGGGGNVVGPGITAAQFQAVGAAPNRVLSIVFTLDGGDQVTLPLATV